MPVFPFYIAGQPASKIKPYTLEAPANYTDHLVFTTSLGDVDYSTSTNTTISLESELDGPPVCVTYDSLYLPSGYTLTTSQRCKGLYINVLGDCTIEGTLSMTARGANCAGKYVTINHLTRDIYYSDEDPGDIRNCTVISAIGGASNSAVGVNGACGAGGRGGWCNNHNGGAGSNGTSFSGGAGGGGATNTGGASAGGANGGAGGRAGDRAGGGAGNPGGAYNGSSGTGGLIILFVSGNLTISGGIQSHGSSGGTGINQNGGGGGGSGGGAIHIFHSGLITGPELVTATGGTGGSLTIPGNSTNGSAGGKGTVNIVQI